MKLETIEKLFAQEKTNELSFTGKCHCCKKDVCVEVLDTPEGITILGGAVYDPPGMEDYFLKCEACYSLDPVLRNYQPTQQYSRVVGYMRPVQDWNKGKQAEFALRTSFKVPEDLTV